MGSVVVLDVADDHRLAGHQRPTTGAGTAAGHRGETRREILVEPGFRNDAEVRAVGPVDELDVSQLDAGRLQRVAKGLLDHRTF
jgi:hypothetical protein